MPLMPFQSKSLAVLAIAVSLLLPWLISGFYVFQATQILIYAIAILGLNLLTGYNGQISLGHGAFYALGAYAVAILGVQLSVPYALALPIAAVLCLAVGFLLGFPALKLEGHYLALMTFALALAMPQLLRHESIEAWTGGVHGINMAKPVVPFGLPLDADRYLYYLCLAIAIAVFWGAANLLQGRIGRAIVAVRDNPVAASAMGVDVGLVKAKTFGVSAMLNGLAGGLSAIVVQYISPDSFNMFLSIFLFVGAVIGGVGSIAGAFIGAAFIVIVPNMAAELSKAATSAVYGLFLIVFIYFLPAGAWGGVRATIAKLRPNAHRSARGEPN